MECGKRGRPLGKSNRNVVRACRDVTRKAKAHLELKLARAVKNNKKGSSTKSVAKGRLGKMWGHC